MAIRQWRRTKPTLVCRVAQGKGGRWRWYLRDRGELVAMSPINGFSSKHDALAAVRRVVGARLTVE